MAIDMIGGGSVVSYQTMTSGTSVRPVQESRDAGIQVAEVAQEVAVNKTDLRVQQENNTDQNAKDDSANTSEQNEKIRKAVEEINRQTVQKNVEAKFGIHKATNRVTIKIVDKETQEVIREVPPEKTLDMIAKAWELAGLMVDERR